MKEAVKWAGVASWFVGLAIILMFSMSTYHRQVLANASHQQLLVKEQRQLQAQAIQLPDARQQSGMNPAPQVEEDPPSSGEKQ